MPFCVFIPCSPDSIEIERIDDLIEGIYQYEPSCQEVFILNDGNTRLHELRSCRYQLLTNPRSGHGWGVGGRLVAGQLFAYRAIYEQWPDLSYILRLDTDAHVIRPFHAALKACFDDRTIGMVGSRIASDTLPPYKVTPPLSYFAGKVRKLKAPLSLWRRPSVHLRCSVYGKHRKVAKMFAAAEGRGYITGELIEGGSFAVSRAWVGNLVRANLSVDDFLDIPITDDLVTTMLTYYLSLRAVDAGSFCIEPKTLRFEPEQFKEHPAAAIIHSIKRYRNMDEQTIRSYFRRLRRSEC